MYIFNSHIIINCKKDTGCSHTEFHVPLFDVTMMFSFPRMPILYESISGGRFLCIMFFLCLTLASLSSMVSLLERIVLLSIDFGSNYT